MSITPGTQFGSYKVAALIGVGGMGEVYRATDTNLKRDVALKVLPDELVTDAHRLARLQREAELLASLNHTNVAHIYGLERSGGHTALVMELIDGVTLAERIAQGPLPLGEALNVAKQIAAALEAAHEQSIVHRDLKPANIKIKSDGTVKVLDFGIAKALDTRALSGPQSPALTTPAMAESGMVLGTAAYMSPEQARGKPVDKRADIWAFGCVLYEMLTGQPAFVGDDVTTTLARVLERDPDLRPLPAGLAPAVRRTLELCLQKDLKNRPRDIGDVRLALEGQFAETTALAQPLWRRALPVAAALVVGALLAGGYVASRVQPEAVMPEVPLPVTRFVITPPATAPLASLGGYDVVISPDGQRLAYFGQTSEQGNVALFVREFDGLDAKLIPGTEVTNPGAGNMNPFFSPDGKSIGFWAPERGVVRVAIDGSPPLKMLDTPREVFLGASWTDDNALVFSAGRSIQRVSAGGDGTPEALTQDIDGFVMSPVLLPGGKAALFGVLTGNVESVAVIDLETGEQKTLIENGQNATYSATGHIVFARGSTLMAAPFAPTELALTGQAVALLQDVRHPNPTTAADYALAANGTLVYVPGGGEAVARAALVWVDRGGSIVGRAVAELVETPRDPRLSPDGTRLAVITGLITSGGLWSYDLRGRPPIRLTSGSDNRLPVWSPDSKEIVYIAISSGPEIFAIPGDGSALVPRPFRAERFAGGPQFWSPAGELFFVNNPTAPDIMVTPAAPTGEIRAVVRSAFAEFDAALAPNGRWLAYASGRGGQVDIWVQGYPDGIPVRVSANGGTEPTWSADGKELFYLQGNAMMAVAVQTAGEFSFGAPVQLFVGPYYTNAAPNVRSYDVARDGRFLMIQPESAGSRDQASIVVVQNWSEELKRRVPAGR